MDRAAQPPLSLSSGQLKWGLREESKKETLGEDLLSFGVGLIVYLYHRFSQFFAGLVRFVFSGFALAEQFKFWLSRRFVRRKGQLAFPFAHATLVAFSVTLLVATAALSGIIFQKPKPDSLANTLILDSSTTLTTEKSDLTRTEAFTYVVREGDDVYKIAERFRRTVDALVSANPKQIQESFGKNGVMSYHVAVGEEITIPPIEGVNYVIRAGDTLNSIARKFGSNAQQIVEFNYIMSSADLKPGLEILVPVESSYLAGSFLAPVGACDVGLKFGWPTKSKIKIGDYTYSHRGIDLAADYEDLYAIGDGVVSAVANFSQRCMSFGPGCNYGYGGLVFIDLLDKDGNPTGLQARYGHISRPLVGIGERVVRGQVVAQSGESGVTFGPHLHFEIYCGSAHQRVNPLPYLED